jgi:hypothetical protein
MYQGAAWGKNRIGSAERDLSGPFRKSWQASEERTKRKECSQKTRRTVLILLNNN